ncbi:hypothetical protein EMCRGX_G012245 [Ephydatia muelleri]
MIVVLVSVTVVVVGGSGGGDSSTGGGGGDENDDNDDDHDGDDDDNDVDKCSIKSTGTITIVHLTSSINVTSMEIRCGINGTTALTWLSPCEMKRLLIGHGLVDNEPFCLTLNLNCSVSVTMANNSNMKSTLRCYSNTGWPNFNGTIVSCLSDGSAKCSIELWAMASSTTTISPSQPTSVPCPTNQILLYWFHLASGVSQMTVQLALPSTNVPESGYGIVVSRNGAPLLSKNVTMNESVFMMEGCYQCYPCQVNITPFCGNTVGNTMMWILNHTPVTPSTLGSSITGSTNGPTTAAPTDDIISVPVLVALVVTVIALPVIIIIIIITILVFAKRRRTGGANIHVLPQSPQTPLIQVVSPEEVSSYQHPPGPLRQYQRDIHVEHIPSGELTSPPPIANATTSFQPIDQPKTTYVYLPPTPGLKVTSDSDVVTVTTNSHPAEGRDDQRAEVFL